MKNTREYRVLGMMSGTSLDGVDLSLATYYKQGDLWSYRDSICETFPYTQSHLDLIKTMENVNTTYLKFRQIQLAYTAVITQFILDFLQKHNQKKEKIDYIGLHGHTIFHSPSQKVTVQAGNLQYLAIKLKINVIGNFRELDVYSGGQGAPLAPFGQELFVDGLYLNLGGIANIGYKGKGHDITFCNMVLNKFSQCIQEQNFDRDGHIGQKGSVDENHLSQLIKQFSNKDNHSLAREECQNYLFSIQKSELSRIELKKQMRTFYEYIRIQIIESVVKIVQIEDKFGSDAIIYCTGGGAYNKFLIKLLNDNQKRLKFILPDSTLIQFKEALIFGLLAVKFVEGDRNCQHGVGGELVKGSL